MQQCVVQSIVVLIVLAMTAATPARAVSLLLADTLHLWSGDEALSIERPAPTVSYDVDAETTQAWLTITRDFSLQDMFMTIALLSTTPRMPEVARSQEDVPHDTTSAENVVAPATPHVTPVDITPALPAQAETAFPLEPVSPAPTQDTVVTVQAGPTDSRDMAPSEARPAVDTALDTPMESFIAHVKQGDTALDLFLHAGVNIAQVQTLQQALRSVYDMRQLHVGHAYRIERTADGQLQRFSYDIDLENRLEVARQGDTFIGHVEPMRYEQHERLVSSRIVGSFYVTLTRQGESPRLVNDAAHIFASQPNLFSTLQQDNALCLLLTERSQAGKEPRYERILAVELRNGDQRFQAVHYAHAQTEGYYQPDGRPLQGAPLSKQHLQAFHAHSERLLAKLAPCQMAPSQPTAHLR